MSGFFFEKWKVENRKAKIKNRNSHRKMESEKSIPHVREKMKYINSQEIGKRGSLNWLLDITFHFC
jgi:hypothetical protein